MFNATNYWSDRKKIGDYMKIQLDNELHKTYARYFYFNLITFFSVYLYLSNFGY